MALTIKLYRKGPIKRRPDRSRHGSIEYSVRSDDINEDMDAIASHASLPTQHVDSHPNNAAMICRSLETDEWEDSDFQYIVTANFDTRDENGDDEEDFTQAKTLGAMSVVTEDRPTFTDSDGNPLANDADDMYEGQTKRHPLTRYTVTHKFAAHPNNWKHLVGTVNNAAITIHGETYPAGTALMLGLDAPDRPGADAGGTAYWEGSYPILIDLDGWTSILPNRGFREYVYQLREYQTRSTTNAPWLKATLAEYNAETNANLKRLSDYATASHSDYAAESDNELKNRIKVRIVDDVEGDVPENVWLDLYGQAMTASFDMVTGTVDAVAGSADFTNTGGLPYTTDDIGKFVIVAGAGVGGRLLRSRINNVTTSGPATTLVLADTAKKDANGTTVRVGGAFCKRFQIEDLADWTGLPLPNNQI